MDSKAIVFESLRKLAMLKGVEVKTERLTAYVDYLAEYKPEQVLSALKLCMDTIKGFPDISDIVKILNPPENEIDQAYDVLDEIMQYLRSHGEMQAKEVKQLMSPVAWSVCEGLGGYTSLCRMTYDELNTMRAQARDMAKSKIKHEKREIAKTPSVQIENDFNLKIGSEYGK